MRRLIVAVSLAVSLLFLGITVALANDPGMDDGGGGSSNNQAAGAAGVAGAAGLVAGAAASGAGATDTQPAGATTNAGDTPPDDTGETPPDDSGETPGESTPGPEPPTPECIACQAQWNVLVGQRTEAANRLAGGLRSLETAFSHERDIEFERAQLVSQRDQALALGGAAIAVAMTYGGMIATRFAAAATVAARNAAGFRSLFALGYETTEIASQATSLAGHQPRSPVRQLVADGYDYCRRRHRGRRRGGCGDVGQG